MTLTSRSLAVFIFIILFGGIAFTTAMGWWATESTKEPITFTEGEFAGLPNPADIRGSYTFGDIEESFGIQSAIVAKAFNIETDDPSAFAVKELEEIYATSELEVGTASVRLFVAFYNGLPLDLTTDMYLPESAAVLLEERPLSPEQLAYLDAHTIPNPAAASDSAEPAPVQEAESTTESESAERVVKGKTTFQEVLDWGVSQETIEQAMDTPMPNPLTKIKDYCLEQGLDFETIKPALQAEVDKVSK
ncbi:MAG: hypothetical protein AB1649_08300 [Chloroflexota bacterium]